MRKFFEMLLQGLCRLFDRMCSKEVDDLCFQLWGYQRVNTFTHTNDRVVWVLTAHLIPMCLQKGPGTFAPFGVEQQRAHQIRGILGTDFAIDGELQGTLE